MGFSYSLEYTLTGLLAHPRNRYLSDLMSEFASRGLHWSYWIWRRPSAWGVGGYAIERQTVGGEYELFALALNHLESYLGNETVRHTIGPM